MSNVNSSRNSEEVLNDHLLDTGNSNYCIYVVQMKSTFVLRLGSCVSSRGRKGPMKLIRFHSNSSSVISSKDTRRSALFTLERTRIEWPAFRRYHPYTTWKEGAQA